jgi:phenylalanyl-tRNA synthetase alpha subunit
VPEATNYESLWRSRWISVAAGGIAADEWATKAGLDPKRFAIIGFAFGLERCAMVSHDLDDIRALWQPPFVPSKGK